MDTKSEQQPIPSSEEQYRGMSIGAQNELAGLFLDVRKTVLRRNVQALGSSSSQKELETLEELGKKTKDNKDALRNEFATEEFRRLVDAGDAIVNANVVLEKHFKTIEK